MGFFNRAMSSRVAKPVALAVNPWFEDSFTGQTLDPDLARYAAIVGAALTLDDRGATAFWSLPDESRIGALSRTLRDSRIMIRVDAVSAASTRITCGAWGPFRFEDDWMMWIDIRPPQGGPSLHIPVSRTLDGTICNEKTLLDMRQRVIESLQLPGLRLSRDEGPPAASTLTLVGQSESGGALSPLQDDYVASPPAGWSDGWTGHLPGVPPESVRCLGYWPLLRGSNPPRWDLRAGRVDCHAEMLLEPDGHGGSLLRLSAPIEDVRNQRRTHVAAVGLVTSLVLAARIAKQEEALAGLDAIRSQLCTPWEAGQRTALAKAWPEGTGLALPIAAGNLIPLKMTLTSGRDDIFRELRYAALGPVLSYERFHSDVLERTNYPKHMRRQVALVVDDDDEITTCLRLAHTQAAPTRELLPKTGLNDSWAWEIDVDAEKLPDGRMRCTAIVSSIGKVGGIVAYGAELIDCLQAMHATALSIDPDLETETVSIRI